MQFKCMLLTTTYHKSDADKIQVSRTVHLPFDPTISASTAMRFTGTVCATSMIASHERHTVAERGANPGLPARQAHWVDNATLRKITHSHQQHSSASTARANFLSTAACQNLNPLISMMQHRAGMHYQAFMCSKLLSLA